MPQISLLDFGFAPGAVGVSIEPSSNYLVNNLYDDNVIVFQNTATKDKIQGRVPIPSDYSSGANLIIYWATPATSGNFDHEFAYNSIADGETIDPAAVTETVGTATAAAGTTLLLKKTTVALTDGNFTALDMLKWFFYRDGASSDTIADVVIILNLFFSYTAA